MDNLFTIKQYSKKDFTGTENSKQLYGYALIIKNFCILTIQHHVSGTFSGTLTLPIKFSAPYVGITDNDSKAISPAYSNTKIDFIFESNKLTYSGADGGHTIIVVGTIIG